MERVQVKTAWAVMFLALAWYFAFAGPFWAWLIAIGLSIFYFDRGIQELQATIVSNDAEIERLNRALDQFRKAREKGINFV